MKSDHELIKEFNAGYKPAFDELVGRHLAESYAYFLRLTGNESEAEDLVQEVFLKIYKALNKFRFESEFKTYLFRANVNHGNTYLKRNKWRNLLHLDQIQEAGYIDSYREKVWKSNELWDAVGTLPHKQRMIVMMRIAQELPYKEISGILEISENAAKVNYHHALKALKNKINHD